MQKPSYGNWVSKKFFLAPGAIGLVILGLSIVIPCLVLIAIPFLLVAAYFLYAWYRFSPGGGNIQDQILELLFQRLDWDGQGQALDIGCGNGPLTIKLAQAFPAAQVTGIDYWGKNWDYAKAACERNAQIEGVAERVTFQKASASALPFEAEHFDLAVSNLTFHEVSDTKDKREVVREALRVVKKGGRFAFQDLFLEKRLYGEPEELVAALKSWGMERVEFVRTCDEPFIPRLLKLPFMVGTIGILYGEK